MNIHEQEPDHCHPVELRPGDVIPLAGRELLEITGYPASAGVDNRIHLPNDRGLNLNVKPWQLIPVFHPEA